MTVRESERVDSSVLMIVVVATCGLLVGCLLMGWLLYSRSRRNGQSVSAKCKSMEMHKHHHHRYTWVGSKGKDSVDGMDAAMPIAQGQGRAGTMLKEETDSEWDGDDHLVTNRDREVDVQSEATLNNPYLLHLVHFDGGCHGAEASVTLSNGSQPLRPRAVPGGDGKDGSGGDSVYGPGPGSPDHGNVTAHGGSSGQSADGPKPAYYVMAADEEQFGHGLSPRFEKLKSARPRGTSSKSRRSSKRSSRRSSRRSQREHLSPSPRTPRGRGVSTLSEAVSELSEITATTLNSSSEGSADGAQPMTYPTDRESMGFTSSSSERDSEPEPIAKRLEHKGGFHAVPMGHREVGNLSDITSMDGDHDFETML